MDNIYWYEVAYLMEKSGHSGQTDPSSADPIDCMNRTQLTIVVATTLFASTLASAHDDPGKLLDQPPPYQGSGYLRGDPATYSNPLNSMAGFDLTLESWLTLPELDGSAKSIDVWGYASPSGREYAIVGTSESTVFVEVTNPAMATLVWSIPGPVSGWRDMKTFGEYCYSVSEGGGGIQIIDLSSIDSGIVTLAGTVDDIQPNTHNVFIDTDSGFLYRCGVATVGLAIYDLNVDPVNPPNVGFWSDAYVHDLQVVTMPSGPFAGQQLAYLNTPGNGINGLTILNVTDKSNPTIISQVTYPGEGFSHQGWLNGDLSRFYINDEGVVPATIFVLNVADPANPFFESSFTNGIATNAHNTFIRDDFLYAANYRQGLRVFDLGLNPLNPPEVAFYDTFPSSDSTGFSGLWGVYPFLPSGTILGSDTVSGLFVWTLDGGQLSLNLEAEPLLVLDPDGGQVATVTIAESGDAVLEETSPVLVVEGVQSVPLVNLGAGLWEGTFPAVDCGELVSYRFEAEALDGSLYASDSTQAIVSQNSVPELEDFEVPAGWTAGIPSDSAVTGLWVRVDPIGTSAQPEDDHTPGGVNCWVTGQGSLGGSIGENDVDGGKTTLRSAVYDLTVYERPIVGYRLWYSNTGGDDTLFVRFSVDGGASWSLLDSLGPGSTQATSTWRKYSFDLAALAPLTDQVMFEFEASDLGVASIVEAAVDDFEILDATCYDGLGQQSCPAVVNSSGESGTILASGSDLVVDNDVSILAEQLPANRFGYFVTSLDAGFLPGAGGSSGNLCLAGQLGRYASQVQSSGANGSFGITIDLTTMPQSPPVGVMPGDTWHFQAWFRDSVMGQTTSNFTNMVSIEFQ